MKHTKVTKILFALFAVVLCFGPVGLAEPMGTAFTYQGRLIDNNQPADGLYDLQFLVCVVDTNGNWPIGEVNKPGVDVNDGYFTVELDFGDIFYDYGEYLWLEIGVRPGDLNDPNVYTFLIPLQKITPTPYALYAKTAGNVFGGIVGGGVSNYVPKFLSSNSIGNSVIYESGGGNVGIGTTSPAAKLNVVGQVKITGGSPGTGKVLTSDAAGLANWQTLTETDPTVLASVKDGVSWGEVSGIPAGFADGVDDVGLTSETDPTVLASVKDGVSWGEVSGIPAGFADGIDDVGAGDNLGNHTATQNIKLSGYWLSGDGGNEGVYVANTGNVGIGTTTLGEKLTVAGTIKATNSSPLGKGVYGEATNSAGAYGGYFLSAGYNGTGVYGYASHGSSTDSYGGYFQAGNWGTGVYGESGDYGGYFRASKTGVYGAAADARGYGVQGVVSGGNGIGIYGEANNPGDSNNYGGFFKAAGLWGYGVWSQSSGFWGTGVFGWATNTGSGTNSGGTFEAAGGGGRGVWGVASHTGNYTNYGGYFEALGDTGRGVYGVAYHPAGIGVLGEGVNGAVGVDGEAVNSGIGVRSYGADYDFYAAGPGMNYGPFTGGHEVKLSDDFPADIRPGMIVSVTGKTEVRRDDKGEISISSTLPTIKLCDVANDKAVFGVFAAEGPLPQKHWYKAKEGERFSTVNALGEGRVWVCNINGEVQVGDYITTSPVSGYGQKQSDDLLRSCTLGKATESVDWDSVTETVEFGGWTYKVYLIAVVYTSG